MLRNYTFIIAYDGTRFFGWERQPGRDTIQGKLESVLTRLQGSPVEIIGAGRTDAGVHARAMAANAQLDGYIARHYNQVSDFGKFADPLADKCLVMAALCWFVETGDMMGWVLAAVLLREFAVSGMRLIAVEKGRVIAAGWSGKVKTASTMVCICLILFGIPHWLNLVCQGVILVTTVYSGVEYFVKNWDVFSEK